MAAAYLSAAVAALLLVGPALADTTYQVQATGYNVVPASSSTATATATLKFNRRTFFNSDVDYSIQITGPLKAIQSISLHAGGTGSNGDLLAYLFGPVGAQNYLNVDKGQTSSPHTGDLKRDQLVGPLSGKSIDDLQDKYVDKNQCYLQISTGPVEVQGRAIPADNNDLRGQLTKQSSGLFG